MAKQTTKTTAKKPVAKKTVVKTAVKKTPAKKTPVKKSAPVIEKLPCGCDKNCACAGKCHEHGHCKCHHGGFWKKLVLFIIVFSLGFACAKLCPCNKKQSKMPRPEFDNGCLVVKCPKMAQMVPMMDTDKNGCVSVDEFKASKKNMRKMKRAHKPQPKPEIAPQPAETVVAE